MDILEDFPCLPHSGSVYFEVVHGGSGPSDKGMFSTAKTQEGGKLCAEIIHCTRLAASSSRTAGAVGSSQGQWGEVIGTKDKRSLPTGYGAARLSRDKSWRSTE